MSEATWYGNQSIRRAIHGRLPHVYVLDLRGLRQISGQALDVEFANRFFDRTVPDWCAGTLVDERLTLEAVFGPSGLVVQALQDAHPGHPAAGALWIMAHGQSGFMQLCDSGLGEANVHRLAGIAHWLRGPCILVGCNVASAAHERASGTCHVEHGTFAPNMIGGDAAVRAGAGYRFLRAMAHTIRQSVTAGLDTQLLPLQLTGWRLSGTTLRVEPTGAYEIRQDMVLSPRPDGQCQITYPDLRIDPSQVRSMWWDPSLDPSRF
jgi:hypothetical protein